MGFTRVTVSVANLTDPARAAEVECLVDTGALHSVVPRAVLERLGIQPQETAEFVLANGQKITRGMGGAWFRLDGKRVPNLVVFGEEGDAALLGVVTLESMSLQVDPSSGQLKPLPNYLMSVARTSYEPLGADPGLVVRTPYASVPFRVRCRRRGDLQVAQLGHRRGGSLSRPCDS